MGWLTKEKRELLSRWLRYLAIGALLVDACLQFPLGILPSALALIFTLLVAVKNALTKHPPWWLLPFMAASTANFCTYIGTYDTQNAWAPLVNVILVGSIAFSYIRVPWILLIAISASLLWNLCSIFDPYTGAIIYLTVTATVILVNFGVKLILDNGPDFRRVVSWFFSQDLSVQSRHIAKVIWLSIPAALFLIFGVAGNLWLQEAFKDNLYESGLVDTPSQSSERNLERDAYSTLDRREVETQAKIIATSNAAELKSKAYADASVEKLMWAINRFTPTAPDIEEACKGFVYKGEIDLGSKIGFFRKAASFFKKGSRSSRKVPFGVDMQKGCAESMQAQFDQQKRVFVGGSTDVEIEANRKKNELLAKESEALREAKYKALTESADTFQRARWLLTLIFWWLPIAGYLSWTFIAVGFFGLLIYLFGRTSFDASNNVPFCLKQPDAKSTQAPSPTELPCFLHAKQLDLSAKARYANGERRDDVWYVANDISRHGDMTHQRLRFPQWFGCFFRRLFNKKLALTLVTTPKNIDFPPTISAPGDVLLVDIVVEGGREVVFHMEDLAAFSEGIKIRSIYSMHAATEFLGIGAFYCVAKGNGRLILKSQGCEVRSAPEGKSLPAGLLLAWDHRATFSLTQDQTLMGTWMNTASVVGGQSGLMIYDESRPGDPLIIMKLWRLARFAALPV